FSVANCAKITDASLTHIANRASLQILSINGVPSITETTMKALALSCKDSLSLLDISFCRQISEQALGLVVDSCQKLEELLLFGCTQIGKSFLYGHSNDNLVRIFGLSMS